MCIKTNLLYSKCRVLTTDKAAESQKKKENWQTVSMSNLVHTMLSRMLQMYNDNNVDSEEVDTTNLKKMQLLKLF